MSSFKGIQKTFLITGVTSFIGKFLIDKLLKETSAHLVLTSRDPEKIEWKNHPRISCGHGDLTRPDSYQEVFEKHPYTDVIHLAAMARLSECERNPMEAIRINLQGSLKLVQMAIKNQVGSFIFTSSDLARHAMSVVGMCKYLIEDEFRTIQSTATRFITIRMPNVIDSPGAVTLLFKKQIEKGGPVTITDSKMSRRFVTGFKAAHMIGEAMQHGLHNELFVSTEQATNITDLALKMMRELKADVPIEYIGAKPGERLSEQGYNEIETSPTSVVGLGKLKNNPFQPEETRRMINHLEEMAKVNKDQEMTGFLNFLKNSKI